MRRPLALGYLRLPAAGRPEAGAALTAELRASADLAGLALLDVYTDRLDPPAQGEQRAGFCALVDAVRHHDVSAVIIPTAEHLSRRPDNYLSRRTIIETETDARLLIIHASRHQP